MIQGRCGGRKGVLFSQARLPKSFFAAEGSPVMMSLLPFVLALGLGGGRPPLLEPIGERVPVATVCQRSDESGAGGIGAAAEVFEA